MKNLLTACAALTLLLVANQSTSKPTDSGNETGIWPLVGSQLKASVKIPNGLRLERFADETQVQNPTALSLNLNGQVYVAETHRWRLQIHDNRNVPLNDFRENHGTWLMEDLACQTIEDRADMLKRWADSGRFKEIAGFEHFSANSEAVRLLTDTDGDGKADHNDFFATGFNSPVAGTAGGIMAWDDSIYFACIPSIWKLKDDDANGKADPVKQVIQKGFGVRTSISGHDLNGFAVGPDRRLYWSVGDRGNNFTTNEGVHYEGVGRGAVFRSELDGSNVERFCDGLRNPKEIAFDDYGNLFTVDNNADLGDEARLYYLMPGGDYGWRMGHQVNAGQSKWVFGDELKTLSVWMEEGLWEMPFHGQASYVMPPVAYITSGPCGFAANPGMVALPKGYDNHFFIVDYRGAAARSGLHTFSMAPSGAGFEIVDPRHLLLGSALTDIEFGYDGKLYMSDYVGGWGMTDKGQILTLFDPDVAKAWRLRWLQRLARKDFSNFSSRTLSKLLRHQDRRIRLRAQFALSDKEDGTLQLAKAANDTGADLQARLHGLWGLGYLARRHESEAAKKAVTALLSDKDSQIKAQALRIIGEFPNHSSALPKMRTLLTDESAYVQSLAAIALGRQADVESLESLTSMIADTGTWDPALRHACTFALQRCADPNTLAKLNNHSSVHVRLAAVVALRGLRDVRLGQFMMDSDKRVRREAARAIYDENVTGAYAALAAVIGELEPFEGNELGMFRGDPEITDDEREARLQRQYHRRAIYAGWHVANVATARAIMGYAVNKNMPELLRLEALHCIETWGSPHALDRVIGDLRPLPSRGTVGIYAELIPQLSELIRTGTGKVLAKAVAVSPSMGYEVPTERLYTLMMNPTMESEARVRALEEWESRDPKNRENVYSILLADGDDWMFEKALEGLVGERPEIAAEVIKLVAYSGSASRDRRQKAISRLEALQAEYRDPIVTKAMKMLKSWELPGLIQLETAAVAEAISPESGDVEKLVAEWKTEAATYTVGEFSVALHGGNYDKGKELFETHAAVQCTRCHALNGRGGNAGPDLAGIGNRTNAGEYILESMINPGAVVAEGWGVVTLTLTDGRTVAGTLVKEDDETLTVKVGDETVLVPVDEVKTKVGPFSAMPPMSAMLNKKELRDLVAFLRAQKQQSKRQKGH